MMNILLSPEEILHVLHSVMKSPMNDSQSQEALISKIERPIIGLLEKEEEKQQEDLLQSWTEQESKKINDLKIKNRSIRSSVKSNKKK